MSDNLVYRMPVQLMSHLAPCHRLQGHPLAAPYSLLLEQLELPLHLQVLQLLGTPLASTH